MPLFLAIQFSAEYAHLLERDLSVIQLIARVPPVLSELIPQRYFSAIVRMTCNTFEMMYFIIHISTHSKLLSIIANLSFKM